MGRTIGASTIDWMWERCLTLEVPSLTQYLKDVVAFRVLHDQANTEAAIPWKRNLSIEDTFFFLTHLNMLKSSVTFKISVHKVDNVRSSIPSDNGQIIYLNHFVLVITLL